MKGMFRNETNQRYELQKAYNVNITMCVLFKCTHFATELETDLEIVRSCIFARYFRQKTM